MEGREFGFRYCFWHSWSFDYGIYLSSRTRVSMASPGDKSSDRMVKYIIRYAAFPMTVIVRPTRAFSYQIKWMICEVALQLPSERFDLNNFRQFLKLAELIVRTKRRLLLA